MTTTDDTIPRPEGCTCHWEVGDSPCSVHPDPEDAIEPMSEANSPAVERAMQRYRDVRDGKREPADQTELDLELALAFEGEQGESRAAAGAYEEAMRGELWLSQRIADAKAEGEKHGYERGLREGRHEAVRHLLGSKPCPVPVLQQAVAAAKEEGAREAMRNHLCPMDVGPALDQSCKEAMETGRREGLELAAQRAGLGYAAGENCDDIARDIRALGDGRIQGAAVWLAEDWRNAGFEAGKTHTIEQILLELDKHGVQTVLRRGCSWCGAQDLGGEDDQRKHAATCEKHPAVLRAMQAEGEVGVLAEERDRLERDTREHDRVRAELQDWVTELEAAARCHVCQEPATCMGQYESMDCPEFACDACCGHACEDGRCHPLISRSPGRRGG
jgi:hypothetical protein